MSEEYNIFKKLPLGHDMVMIYRSTYSELDDGIKEYKDYDYHDNLIYYNSSDGFNQRFEYDDDHRLMRTVTICNSAHTTPKSVEPQPRLS